MDYIFILTVNLNKTIVINYDLNFKNYLKPTDNIKLNPTIEQLLSYIIIF